MGNQSSKDEANAEQARHAAEKAAKAEFKAREARRKAECVAKGVSYTKGKFVPPGYYDARPGDWPAERRAADLRSRPAQPYYGHPQQGHEAEMPYGPPEVGLMPEERTPYERAGGSGQQLYPQIAAQARPQPQGHAQYQQQQAQQPQYRVVELRDVDYGEPSHGPSWMHPSGGAVSKDRRLISSETARESTEAWRRHKAELMQHKQQVDAQLRELKSTTQEHAAKFRDITERERQLRLAEENEMERRAEIRKQRAELKHREQQLKEREAAREYYLNEERQAEKEAQKYRKTAAAGDRSRLEAMETRKRDLETELQREQQFLHQTRALSDAEVARLEKLRGIEANLNAQHAELDKELRQLRMREHEHQQKVERLTVREREFVEEERRIRTEQAAKEKRASEKSERDIQREKSASDAEFEALKKHREALDKAEKDSQEKQNQLHREIQAAEKERNKNRAEAEKAAMEREKAVAQKPVVPARDIRESVQSAFQYAPEHGEGHAQQAQKTPYTQRPGESTGSSFAEKTRRGFEQLKEKVTGSSSDTGHAVPGGSDKDTAVKIEREQARPMSTQSQRVSQHDDSSARAHTTRDIHVRREIES